MFQSSVARAALAAALAVCLLAGCAGDDDARASGEPPISFEQFESADRDHDGKLSQAEAQSVLPPRLLQNFGRLDSDRSGFLSWSELRAARYGPRRPLPPIRGSGWQAPASIRDLCLKRESDVNVLS